jgi:uncharacterized membrane protein YhhN
MAQFQLTKIGGKLLMLFGIAALLNTIAEICNWQLGIWISKPLIMLSLLFVWVEFPILFSRFSRLMTVGFCFALLGDVFLMLVSSTLHPPVPFFLLGLASFLMTHLFYLSAFLAIAREKQGWVRQKSYTALPLVGIIGLMIWVIWPGLGDLRIPVVVYALTIMSMAISALNLKGLLPNNTWMLLFGSVLIFVVSDGLIALNKFWTPLGGAQILVMITYIIAQGGIFMAGLQIRHLKIA